MGLIAACVGDIVVTIRVLRGNPIHRPRGFLKVIQISIDLTKMVATIWYVVVRSLQFIQRLDILDQLGVVVCTLNIIYRVVERLHLGNVLLNFTESMLSLYIVTRAIEALQVIDMGLNLLVGVFACFQSVYGTNQGLQ